MDSTSSEASTEVNRCATARAKRSMDAQESSPQRLQTISDFEFSAAAEAARILCENSQAENNNDGFVSPTKKAKTVAGEQEPKKSELYAVSLLPSRMSLRTLISPQVRYAVVGWRVPLLAWRSRKYIEETSSYTRDLTFCSSQLIVSQTDNATSVQSQAAVAIASALQLVHAHAGHMDLTSTAEAKAQLFPSCVSSKKASRDISRAETASCKRNESRAASFAASISALQEELLQAADPDMNAINFKLVAAAEMSVLAKRLLDQQDCLRDTGDYSDPATLRVDIGYIYTDRAGAHQFLQPNVLTTASAHFGSGVYTANNPFCGHPANYYSQQTDSIGVFCARLRGDTKNGLNSVIGRQGRPDEVVVLGSESQCLPLAMYDSGLVELDKHRNEDAPPSAGNEMVYEYHCHLQDLVDEVFNGGRVSHVPKVLPADVLPSLPQLVPHY